MKNNTKEIHGAPRNGSHPGYILSKEMIENNREFLEDLFKYPCFGERKEAYDKCEDCDKIKPCSAVTLRKYLGNSVYITW
jgi:hypothetical protein